MAEVDLVVKMLSDLNVRNSSEHKSINDHLAMLNGSAAKIKKSNFMIKGILMGVAGTLLILGFMPERLWEVIKNAI